MSRTEAAEWLLDRKRRASAESALRNAIIATRSDASISMVSGKYNLVLTVVVPQPEFLTSGQPEAEHAVGESGAGVRAESYGLTGEQRASAPASPIDPQDAQMEAICAELQEPQLQVLRDMP